MTTIESKSDRMNAIRSRCREIGERIKRIQRMEEEPVKDVVMAWFGISDVATLVEESKRLNREMEMLSGHMIRENLAKFGIEDLKVTAKVEIKVGYGGDVVRTMDVGRGMLSNFCLPEKYRLNVEYNKNARETDDGCMLIFLGDEKIGYVDSVGRFHFTAAPNLRVCVGWAVATDCGRAEALDYDLSYEVNKLEYAIKMAPPLDGTCEDSLRWFCFRGTWNRAIMEVMEYEKGSLFCEGYLDFTTMFWMVATRTIRGREHPAFTFFR